MSAEVVVRVGICTHDGEAVEYGDGARQTGEGAMAPKQTRKKMKEVANKVKGSGEGKQRG